MSVFWIVAVCVAAVLVAAAVILCAVFAGKKRDDAPPEGGKGKSYGGTAPAVRLPKTQKEVRAEIRGEQGERAVSQVIGRTELGKQYVLNGYITADRESGMTSQIDHIVINRNGVHVIETKNYSGRIYGSDGDSMWTQTFSVRSRGRYGRPVWRTRKKSVRNPVKQNGTHVYRVRQIVQGNMPVHSVVVLVRGNTQFIDSEHVFALSELRGYLNRVPARAVSVPMMEKAYDLLRAGEAKGVTAEDHRRNIEEQQYRIRHNICPRCGGRLVMKDGRYGRFCACENYPKCTFTKDAGRDSA